MTKEEKVKAYDLLVSKTQEMGEMLQNIEERLFDYYEDIALNIEHHNAYEILGALKFLRLLRTYEIDIETFQDVIFKYEGRWEQYYGGYWHHIEGGLKHPGTTGPQFYRLQPFQVFVLASMFLLKVWINTESEAGTRDMLPTERARNGYIEDLRRLCTEFTLFTPRKTAKTPTPAIRRRFYSAAPRT